MKPNAGAGDGGETNILGGRRVRKDSTLVEALGAIDEASCAIGFARAVARDAETKETLLLCQQNLRKCAAEIAAAGARRATDFDFRAAVRELEERIESTERGAQRPEVFIMPGQTQAEAALHTARAAVRRVERRVFGLLAENVQLPVGLAPWLNRLSDLLFDLAYAEASC